MVRGAGSAERYTAWWESGDASSIYSSRVKGCLLGGAIGDALGAPLEFLSLEHIRRDHPDRDYVREYREYNDGASRGFGLITDDTQMTLGRTVPRQRPPVREMSSTEVRVSSKILLAARRPHRAKRASVPGRGLFVFSSGGWSYGGPDAAKLMMTRKPCVFP